MYILLGFPESARKQDFHLDEAKRSRETNDTGKEQPDLIFQNIIKISWWPFRKQTQQFTLKYSRMTDNSGQVRSTKSVQQVCPSQTLKIKSKIIHLSISNEQWDACFPKLVYSEKFIAAIILVQVQVRLFKNRRRCFPGWEFSSK